MATKVIATAVQKPTTPTATAPNIGAAINHAAATGQPTVVTPAGVTRPTKDEDPKMVAAGHKAAAKSKQTERASWALVYAFEHGAEAGMLKAFDGIKAQEWAALAVARALRECETTKELPGNPAAHAALAKLFATLKPRASVGASVPADPARAVLKRSKAGRLYMIVSLPTDSKLAEGLELQIAHAASGFTATVPGAVAAVVTRPAK